MRFISILIFALFCFSSLPDQCHGYEARSYETHPSERVHYHAFATRFAETLKAHPPVTDCQVTLLENDFESFIDHIKISVEISREALLDFLHQEHNRRFVSQNDQDRYLIALQGSIHGAASEIFSDIKHEAIEVTLHFSNQ